MPTSLVPPYHEFFNPILKALRQLGGSGSIEEINQKATEIMGLSEKALEVLHNPEAGNTTEVEYRLAWGRTYLKKYGLINNSSRGVWALLPKADEHDEVDPRLVIKRVNEKFKESRIEQTRKTKSKDDDIDEEIDDGQESWRREVHQILTETLTPDAFERLVQRLLRESGFIQVEVTGRSGDGGIDGKGIAKIHGLMSFHVVFQAKRYKGVVTPSMIRDFRGALVGRADKGLFITTGSFTRDALKEATRDGAPPIDLLDGDQLADKLKELNLGIATKLIEVGEVDALWFKQI